MCRPYRLRPSLLATLAAGQGDREVFGLTKLDNALYVIYRKSDTINVYTAQQPYTQLRSIHVNGLKIPTALRPALSTTACMLLTMGVAGSGKWRSITLQSSGLRSKIRCPCLWRRMDALCCCWRLMYSAAENTARVTVEWKCTMQLASDWQSSNCQTALLTRITSYKQPTSLSLFVTETETELNRVCEVNNEGNIVTSYGGSRGSGLGQLDAPAHIVLDSEERVIVADCANRRVLLLSRQLDIQRVLLSWSRDYPGRLHYDTVTSQLMVGMQSGRVEIYRLQWNFTAMDQS